MLTDSLLVPDTTGITDLDSDIDQIMLKPMYASKKRGTSSLNDTDNMLSATPTLNVQ